MLGFLCAAPFLGGVLHMVAPDSHRPAGQSPRWGRVLAGSALVLSLGLVLWLTLQPHAHSSPGPRGNHWVPFSEAGAALRAAWAQGNPWSHPAVRFWIEQMLGNVVVFMPLGGSIYGWLATAAKPPKALRRIALATGGGAIVSLVVEAGQMALPSRATDIDDLILNTLGAGLGATVTSSWLRWRRR